MGLDMHMVQKPETVPPGYTCQYEDQPEYFRVNSGAVPLMIALATAAGALVEEELPLFPDRPPKGLTIDRLEDIEAQQGGGDKLANPLNPAEAKDWLLQFAACNELAVQHGGYHVS